MACKDKVASEPKKKAKLGLKDKRKAKKEKKATKA